MKPGSPEWARLVTASKVAAIVGLSPWDSPLTMWHKMRGDLPSDDGSNAGAKARGHYLEDGILAWWADRPGEPRSIATKQAQHALGDWAMATPDALGYVGETTVLVEVKTDAKASEWLGYTDAGEIVEQVPAHYAVQALWQLACAPDAERVYFPVLHRYLDMREYTVDRDEATIGALVAHCHDFYDSLSRDTPPDLSGMACEYAVVRRINADIDRDATVVLPDDLIADYLADAAHEARADGTKARVLALMGRARLAKDSADRIIARRQGSRGGVSLVRVADPDPITSEPTKEPAA